MSTTTQKDLYYRAERYRKQRDVLREKLTEMEKCINKQELLFAIVAGVSIAVTTGISYYFTQEV
jgi:aspartate/methionine/tyrosine aminotransferase